jgi:hypothetical protein
MKLKLFFLFVFISVYSWSQTTTQTFDVSGTFTVPVGVTSINIAAWGGGGAGGGASGAALLAGRGGAGGGGGAYASKALAVSEGEILNVIVASQTAGTSGADGNAGGNSTITGFETSILAAGGSGGAGNNAAGIPAGGVGGTVAASAGDILFAGVSGMNGQSWLIATFVFPFGGGGAGANSGGAGGAFFRGELLRTKPGNAGTAPGGAGSGAVNSTSGPAQVGGTGGAGRVIISYTAPSLKEVENNVSVNSINKVLNIDSSDRNINQVFVYDISGNLIYKKDRVSNPKLVIDNVKSSNQVLVVKVVLDNNQVEIKKVVY